MAENRLDQGTPKREGTEGGRFTGSTDEAGPMKPGNSVEDKTLKTRQKGINILKERSVCRRLAIPGNVTGIGEVVDER
jgi:hypothetical protein